MTNSHQTIAHGSITLERVYGAHVSRVFAAFEHPEQRRMWNSPASNVEIRDEANDFSVGGRDLSVCVIEGEDAYRVEARYIDIVRDSRLLFTEAISDMERLLGASLVSIEFLPREVGTRLVVTIQTAGLDGSGLESGVIEGWTSALDNLERVFGTVSGAA